MRPGRSSLLYLFVSFIPALLSFFWFRLVRAVLKRLKAKYIARHPESCTQWQSMNGDFVRKPLVLPLIMTGAPRWNPHALIATLGPFQVTHALSIQVSTARASAGQWFFVLYSYPQHQTIGLISSLADPDAPWQSLAVPSPGQYMIGARYYHPESDVRFPKVRADDVLVGPEARGAANANAFYTTLRQRETFFYRSLQFYMVALLRCQDRFPARFIQREFLPVGNPETDFAFGFLRPGEVLELGSNPGLTHNSDVYVTFYSRGSFPIAWFEWDAKKINAPFVAQEAGFYLVRMQKRKSAFATPSRKSQLAAAR